MGKSITKSKGAFAREWEIIIPASLKPQPDQYELRVARICAQYFQSDIKFVARGISTTPDIYVMRTHQFWEIKNIQGNSKRTIANNLRKANKQAQYIIISLLKPTKMTTEQATSRIRYFVRAGNVLTKSILLVTKVGKIIIIK